MKKMLYGLIYLLMGAALFAVLFFINMHSSRVDVGMLTQEKVYETGPVLLEGGNTILSPSGEVSYRLRFGWEAAGYLYIPYYTAIEINGTVLQSESSYRGDLYVLPSSEDGEYEIILHSRSRHPFALYKAIYLGTFQQVNDFITTSVVCNSFINGLCSAVLLFSLFLFFWKRSERYLPWLALLAFVIASYRRFEFIFQFIYTFLPLSFITDGNFYRIINELVVTGIQLMVFSKLTSSQMKKRPLFLCVALAAIPALLSMPESLFFSYAITGYYAVAYLCYLIFFLKIPKEARFERHIFLAAWVLTTTSRLFEQCCEIGFLPYGDINLRLRFRGIISIIYVSVLFLVACKRFAQKFQEADTLNLTLEEQIVQKSKQQTIFIRSMLHNIKTPLFSLSGYSEMAQKTIDVNPAKAKNYISKTHEGALYVSHMVDRIFFVTQMESGSIAFGQVPINLSDILHSVAQTAQLDAHKKGITLITEMPSIMFATGDPLYLPQAFQNIVDNALLYTPPNGSIRICGQAQENNWLITITDTGSGIARAEQDKIFDAHYSNRPDNVRSSGLGLYITKEIILRHRGRIQVESVPGHGASFLILLPSSQAQPSSDNGSVRI